MNPWRIIVMAALKRTRHGSIEFVEGDRVTEVGETGTQYRCRVTINSPKVWRQLLRGSTGLAHAYSEGYWDCDEMLTLTQIAGFNVDRFDRLKSRFAFVIRPAQRLTRMRPDNKRSRAREQIAAHYDLGNDMFELFLDSSMNYSSAVYQESGQSLEEAQVNKMNRICDRLQLGPDDHLLEIGTGWGGLAVHLAKRSGCRITTTTISAEQAALARQRIESAGLSGSIEVLEVDYRDLTGTYDKLVSIEMIEAVGWKYFPTYFAKCSELLKPDGAMLLQSITVVDEAYEIEKTSRNFTNSIIFPGGCLPSRAEIERCLGRYTDMDEIWAEDIGADYADTLAEWRRRFVENEDSIIEFGYDLKFRRMWQLYLTWAEGGFRVGRIQDYQMLLAKPGFVAGDRDRSQAQQDDRQAVM